MFPIKKLLNFRLSTGLQRLVIRPERAFQAGKLLQDSTKYNIDSELDEELKEVQNPNPEFQDNEVDDDFVFTEKGLDKFKENVKMGIHEQETNNIANQRGRGTIPVRIRGNSAFSKGRGKHYIENTDKDYITSNLKERRFSNDDNDENSDAQDISGFSRGERGRYSFFRDGRGRSGSFRGDRGRSSSFKSVRGRSSSYIDEGGRSSSFKGDRCRSSSFTDEDGRSSSFTDDRGRSSSFRGDRGRSSSFRGDRGRSSSNTDDLGRTSSFRGDRVRSRTFRGDRVRSRTFRGDRGRSSSFRGGRDSSYSFRSNRKNFDSDRDHFKERNVFKNIEESFRGTRARGTFNSREERGKTRTSDNSGSDIRRDRVILKKGFRTPNDS